MSEYRLNEFDDDEVTEVVKTYRMQQIPYMKAERRVYTGTVASLSAKFNELYPSQNVSKNFFYLHKPFYVKEPTRREKQECLCSTCFNCHQVYKAYCMKDKVDSLTKFLSMNLCTTLEDGRFKDHCIKGLCKNETCRPFEDKCDSLADSAVQFYIFEVVEESYTSKKGEKKTSKRTARVDITESRKEVGQRLEKMTVKYLLHKNRIFNHDEYFPLIEKSAQCIITQDWSENIQEKSKYEVQSAHFSGKQIVLHCTIVQTSGKTDYVYHFSDVKKKDWATGKWILNHVIENFVDKNLESDNIIRKTDNCREQYKSRQVFGAIQSLASSHNRSMKLVYGPPGHGRGLIDAMGAFGVKTILRKEILINDVNLDSAAKMVKYFTDINTSADRHYFVIDDEEVAKIRENELLEIPIKGNTRCPVIEFRPEGEKVFYSTYLCGCNSNIVCSHNQSLNIDSLEHCDEVDVNSNEIDDGHEVDDEDNDCTMRREIMWSSVEPNQFVVSPSFSSFESFYILKVIEKGFNSTEDTMKDTLGHTVAPGQQYLICQYFEKGETNFRKGLIRYKKSRIDNVYIDPKLLISPYIEVKIEGKSYIDIDLQEFLSIKY